jgi:hypothetical protein
MTRDAGDIGGAFSTGLGKAQRQLNSLHT